MSGSYDTIRLAPAFDDMDYGSRAEVFLDREQADYNHDADLLVSEFEAVFRAGWGWAFAIIGMAEAIRANPRTPLIVERSYWTSELDGRRLYDCTCPGCGVQLKGRQAGVHEGTDLEWCGRCRDGEW